MKIIDEPSPKKVIANILPQNIL